MVPRYYFSRQSFTSSAPLHRIPSISVNDFSVASPLAAPRKSSAAMPGLFRYAVIPLWVTWQKPCRTAIISIRRHYLKISVTCVKAALEFGPLKFTVKISKGSSSLRRKPRSALRPCSLCGWNGKAAVKAVAVRCSDQKLYFKSGTESAMFLSLGDRTLRAGRRLLQRRGV